MKSITGACLLRALRAVSLSSSGDLQIVGGREKFSTRPFARSKFQSNHHTKHLILFQKPTRKSTVKI